jgi:hypothetical protein
VVNKQQLCSKVEGRRPVHKRKYQKWCCILRTPPAQPERIKIVSLRRHIHSRAAQQSWTEVNEPKADLHVLF